MERIVVGITGASGVILGYRTVEVLASLGFGIELVMTPDAHCTAALELKERYSSLDAFLQSLPEASRAKISVYKYKDFMAPIASGSFPTRGMIISPCSMASLAAIAAGLSDNLLRRAADVTLKERRRLVIVPREAPFSEIHLENMLKLTRMGAVIVPPIPGWYTGHKTLNEVEDFIVGRTLDALGISTNLYPRWGIKN